MTTWRDDLTALADELEAEFDTFRLDIPIHLRLRNLLAAHPAPEAPEATVVEEFGVQCKDPDCFACTNAGGAVECDEETARLIVTTAKDRTLVRRTITTSPWVEVETTTEGATP